MKTITLRGIPEPIAASIADRASRSGASLNRTVLQMLADISNSTPVALYRDDSTSTVYHDLDHLAGTWTTDEADAFDALLRPLR